MKSRKPSPSSYDAFVSGAEPEASAPLQHQKVPPHAQEGAWPKPDARATAPAGLLPWKATGVRDDVKKHYQLRLPEPLYLQLKWVADQTNRSINSLCRDAIEREIGPHLPT